MIKQVVSKFMFLFLLTFAIGMFQSAPVMAADSKEEIVVKDEIQYVKLKPIVIPVMGHDGSVQIISIAVAIEVPDTESEELVRTNRLRLTDAFITDMYGVLGQSRLMHNGFLNVEGVKTRLGKISKKIVGDEAVTGILLESVQQRRV